MRVQPYLQQVRDWPSSGRHILAQFDADSDVGFVPGFAGAHSQGESLDELQRNLREVIEMLLEDCEPELE